MILTDDLISRFENAEAYCWGNYVRGLSAGDLHSHVEKIGEATVIHTKDMNTLLMNRVKNYSAADIDKFEEILEIYGTHPFVFDLVPQLSSKEVYDKLLEANARPVVHYNAHYKQLANHQIAETNRIRDSHTEEYVEAFLVGVGVSEDRMDQVRKFQRLGWGTGKANLVVGEQEGKVVATGMYTNSDKISVFGGATTNPDYRKQGYQSEVLTYRLNKAKEKGMDYAICDAVAGSVSSRNVLRAGFQVYYTRTYWRVN